MSKNKNIERFEDYVEKIDWRVKENSNTNYSWQGLLGHLAHGAVLDWVAENDDPESVKANDTAFIHKHDLSAWIIPYCSGWSAKDLLLEGFNCGNNFVAAAPAKNLNTFLNQMVNAIFTFSGEFAGAQAFNSIDTFSAGFIKYNNMTDREIEQAIQSFVYNLNVKTRIAMQAPFSNLSFDLTCPKDMENSPVIIGGQFQDFTYGDCKKEMERFTIAFCKVMVEGDATGKPFTFPIPTFSITEDFPFRSKLSKAIFTFANEANIPYFSNFINSGNSPREIRSMCPLYGDTSILYVDGDKTKFASIIDLYLQYLDDGKEIDVVTPGLGVAKGKPIKVPATDILLVKLGNDKFVKMGVNHLQPIEGGDVLKASELKVGMRLPFTDASNHIIEYVPITSIEKRENKEPLYCFEVDSPDRLFVLANGLVTHNCRLRLDLTELRKKAGGLFGAGDKTGSIGVVTLNLSRMGYIAKILADETNANPRDVATAKKILKDNFPILYEDLVSLPKDSKVDIFMEILDYFLSIAKNALVAKRRYCDKTLEMGMLPYTKRYLGHFNNHFNTISVNAGHECCLNLFGKGIDDPECRAFMQSVLDHILDKCKKFQEEDGDILYNLEAAPAESCGTRFAKSDRKDFEDIVTGEGTNGTFYTNSTMLPESYSENIFAVCEHQDGLIDKYTGGSVIHIYMNEPLPSWTIAENLIRKIFTNYRIPYMSISPDLCICPIHGRLPKSYDYCPYEHSQEDIDRLVKQGVLSKDDIVLIE